MRKIIPFITAILMQIAATAQELDIDKLMEKETKSPISKADSLGIAMYTFKSTRVANGHSVETLPKGVMDAKIQHRFGYLSGGWKNFFGLDNAEVRLGADYGITDRLMIGAGRSTYEKQMDGFLKYKMLQQKSGSKMMPITLDVLASVMLNTVANAKDLGYEPHFSDRLSYAFQVLIARKLSPAFSLQLMPTLVHSNIVDLASMPNNIIALGAATSVKVTKRSSLTLEYYYNFPKNKFDNTYNALSIGWDIETGGHVFQLLFTNGSGVAEKPFITNTTGKFFDGDIRFGFNVNRAFSFGKKKIKKVP